MAKIKVKYGGCGIKYTDGNGMERHALKTPEHGPFECDDAQAERLVGMGVAEYVGPVWREESNEPDPDAQQEEHSQEHDEQQEETGEPAQEPEKVMGHLSAEDLETWDYNQLRKLAADMGVKPEGNKKSDYIAAIVAVEVELGPEVDPYDVDDPDNDLPVLSAADPE